MSDNDNNQNADQQKPLFSIGNREYDVDAAVNKITSADNHIQTLENERKADKERIEALEAKLAETGDLSAKLDSALEKLNGSNQQANQTGSVDLDALRKQVLEEAAKVSADAAVSFEKQKIAEANTIKNIDLAKQKFGTEFETKLREEGAKLGYNDEDIQKLAKGDSERFKRLFNLEVRQTSSEPAPNSGFNARYKPKPPSDLPSVTGAWNSEGRVNALQERLKAKLKEKNML